MKHIIETVREIYEILLIWWVDPQYPWSQGIGSPIWGSSMCYCYEYFSNDFCILTFVHTISNREYCPKYFNY